MGNICDQICFQTLALDSGFHRTVQSISDIVDQFCHLSVFAAHFFTWDLVFQITGCDLLDSFFDPVFFNRPFDQKDRTRHIHCKCEDQKCASENRHQPMDSYKSDQQEDHFHCDIPILPE